MKTSKERKGKGKGVEPPRKCNESTGSVGVNKSTKRSGAQGGNSTGLVCQQLPDEEACPPATTKESPLLKLSLEQILDPLAKMKLQLFPLNEGTRLRLEEEGHHPYLELILRPRKKISSVVRHINNKWGSSSIALGEPMLFPFHLYRENMSGYRAWSLNDDDVTAGDVYAATGSPSVFRLRYGWFSSDPKNFAAPSTLVASEPGSKSEGVQKGCSSNMENLYGKGKSIEITSNEFEANNTSVGPNVAAVEKASTDVSSNPVADEVRLDNGLSQTLDIWADGLTNISIGGLLSEASLQAKLNNCNGMSDGSKSGFRIPSKSAPFEDCSGSGGIQKGCSSSMESAHGKRKEIEVTGGDYEPTNLNEVKKAVEAEKMNLDLSADPQDNEMRTDSLSHAAALWDDCLTNISIGGLLSEASLQGKFSNGTPKQPTLLISDSLDSFISGQIQLPQGPRLSAHDGHSSILDAEETCHAFPCQRASSSGKDILALGGANSGTCSQGAGSKPFKLPKFAEASSQTGPSQDHTCVESKTDPSLCSGSVYADDSSLGLSDIKWDPLISASPLLGRLSAETASASADSFVRQDTPRGGASPFLNLHGGHSHLRTLSGHVQQIHHRDSLSITRGTVKNHAELQVVL